MKKLLRILAAAGLGLSLTTGFVAAETGTIDTTGPESVNDILFENKTEVELENKTEVEAQAEADQEASSGDTKVAYNTSGGSAHSGDADNENEVEADVEIDNSGSSALALENACGCDDENEASIEYTGPYSENYVYFENKHEVEVENKTDVDFESDVEQRAYTGDASVYKNTTGGDAVSGNASNTNSTVFTLNVTN